MAFQKTHIGFLALGIAALGLAVFLVSSDSPTQESSPDISTEASSGNGNLENELAACGNEFTDQGKQACVAFIKQQCPTLKANYALQERTSIASQDPGFRVSVLQQHHDPFYPVKCFREWLLIESEFAYPDRFPVHSHEPHDEVEMSGDYPRAFSQFPDFSEYSPEYFAHKDAQGKLQFPEKYEIEKKYSLQDQELLNRALHAAYKYADINAAIRDGYVTVPGYILSMGIHFMNPSLFDETVNMDEPEFLTYLKSRSNNAYVLAQIGYIHVKNDFYKKYRYPLFETSEAHGHNHLLNASFINKNKWWRYGMYTKDEPTEGKILVFLGSTGTWIPMESTDALAMYNDMKAQWAQSVDPVIFSDSLWMMHVAINLYNEDGLFADTFPLIDTMAKTGEIYSFLGRKFDPEDYVLPVRP